MIIMKILPLLYGGILLLSLGCSYVKTEAAKDNRAKTHWSTARRDSANLAPNPVTEASSAIIQVYTAPTYGWRGVFAVQPWIIFKRAGETRFTRYEVLGWGGSSTVRRDYAVPDGYWFGAKPTRIAHLQGEQAAALIAKIEAAIQSYPYPETYHAWPGPNSNTFLAHIGREVPELNLDLPANAIGKDYRSVAKPIGLPPSGSGLQVSVLGVWGFILSKEEGIELNVLGLNLGVDVASPALRLPFIGRIGTDS